MKRVAVMLAALLALSAGAVWAANGGDQPERQARPAEIMPLADKIIINDVVYTGQRYVAVGARGGLFVSDAGDSWTQVQVPVRDMLNRVVFYNADIGWAVGWDATVLRTEDGGQHWQLVHFNPDWGRAYFDVMPTGPDSAIVVGGRGRYLVTQDAGAHWSRVKNTVFEAGWNLYDIQRIDANTLVIAGERGFSAISTDNGATWKMLKPPYNGSFFGVRPYGDHGALFFGLQGRVYTVKDVRTLPTIDNPGDYTPFTFQAIPPVKLAAMGWHRLINPVQESLYDGIIYDGHYFLGVGGSGAIVTGDIDSGKLHAIENEDSQPFSSVLIRGDKLLLTGRTGFYHKPWAPGK